MENPNKQIEQQFETNQSPDDHQVSCEQYGTWFLGSLMREKNTSWFPTYNRLSTLHNRITQEETNFNDQLQINMRLASQLSEFFPQKWLLEITMVFKKRDIIKLRIKSYKDRVCFYLGYIELYLTFRGLTLLDSTLTEINEYLGVNITKNEIRTWKIKLIQIIPGLQAQWIKIRTKNHQTALISTIVQVMNRELRFKQCSKEQIFMVKQQALMLGKKFVTTEKARYVKKPEVWARAICTKALHETLPSYQSNAFPDLTFNTRKVIENKRWQLDQLLD
ncbi:MAG: hypothetical protein ACFFBQ_16215 [Promethearchaeota archaeon]